MIKTYGLTQWSTHTHMGGGGVLFYYEHKLIKNK